MHPGAQSDWPPIASAAMEHPPPSATVPPLRERIYTPASQRRLLQDQLLGVALYRFLVGSQDAQNLLQLLEREFDALIGGTANLQEDGVYCLKFPPLVGPAHFLIRKCSERYHLQTASFGEEEDRFVAVYLHPRDAMAPVLRLDDFRHARSYYLPPPPPPSQYEPQRKLQRRARDEGYSLDAELLPLTQDYTQWTRATAGTAHYKHGGGGGDGYECEIAECHEHILEMRTSAASPPAATMSMLAARLEAWMAHRTASSGDEVGLVALRGLPAGCAGVFASADAARRFVDAHRVPNTAAEDGADGFTALSIGAPHEIASPSADEPSPRAADDSAAAVGGAPSEPVACEARVLASLQRRRGGGSGAAAMRGRGGAPRALQAALRGMGGGPRGRGGR